MKKSFLLFLFILLQIFPALGKEFKDFSFYFENDTIVVEQGKTFINFLILENNGKEVLSLQNLKTVEYYPGLLLAPPSNLVLEPGQSQRFPIKFLANLNFMKMQLTTIDFQINRIGENNQTSKQIASFYISKNEDHNISLYSFSQENYLDPGNPESTISLFVENKGFSKRSIKLTFQSNPSGLQILPSELTVSLEGLERKLVEFKVSFRHQPNSFPDYRIQVKAQDLISNENVGSVFLKMVILTSSRQMLPNNVPERNRDSYEFSYNQQSESFRYLKLSGNSSFTTNGGIQGNLNTGLDYYLDQNAYNIFDTWLEFRKDNSKIRLGNLYGDEYDYSVTGRGAKLNWQLNRNNNVEVLALDNNYNLFGNYYPQNIESKIIGAKYNFGNEKSGWSKLSFLFDYKPRMATQTNILNFTTPFILDSVHKLRLELGISHEEGLIDKEGKFGSTYGINYESKIGLWDFHSLNSFSTRQYAGLKRGTTFFNQSIGYQISKRNRVFIQYQNSIVEPQHLSFQIEDKIPGMVLDRPYYYYKNQSLITGFQISTNRFNFLISPQVIEQKNISEPIYNHLTSYRMRLDIGTGFLQQYLNFSTEYAFSNLESLPDWLSSFRTTLSYRYKGLSMNALYQFNPTDISDFSYYNRAIRNFQSYSLYTSYSFQSPEGKFSGVFSAGLNYSELYRNTNQNLNGNVEYKILPSWAATAYANYTKYKSTGQYEFEGKNVQFRIGIKKYFTKATSAGNYKVNLHFYQDKNDDGIFNKNEHPIAFEPIQLDEFIAITDKNGSVRFQNVPPGKYKLKLKGNEGVKLKGDPFINVEGNTTLHVGLIKDHKLSGKLIEIKQQYDSQESNVTGVIVYAKNEEGEIFTTVVDQNNNFEFFLKNGIYEIYIQNDKYQYLHPNQIRKIQGDESVEELIFEYKKKNKEIKVKKF